MLPAPWCRSWCRSSNFSGWSRDLPKTTPSLQERLTTMQFNDNDTNGLPTTRMQDRRDTAGRRDKDVLQPAQQAGMRRSAVEHSRPPEADVGDDRISARSGPVQVLYGGVLEVRDLSQQNTSSHI